MRIWSHFTRCLMMGEKKSYYYTSLKASAISPATVSVYIVCSFTSVMISSILLKNELTTFILWILLISSSPLLSLLFPPLVLSLVLSPFRINSEQRYDIEISLHLHKEKMKWIYALWIFQLILPSPFYIHIYMVMVSDIKLSVAEVHGCTWPTFFTVNLPNLGWQEKNKNK